jgi:hypothetical protein
MLRRSVFSLKQPGDRVNKIVGHAHNRRPTATLSIRQRMQVAHQLFIALLN